MAELPRAYNPPAMDEKLKARLIGAAVLVLMAVLLIPEMLSSRRPVTDPASDQKVSAGRRSYTIELGKTPAADARAPEAEAAGPATGALESLDTAPSEPARPPGGEPVAASTQARKTRDYSQTAASTSSEDLAPKPVAAPKPPAEPRPPPAKAAAPAVARTGWSVQVGAFRSVESAQKLARELTAAGYSAYVVQATGSGQGLNRVRVGPEPDKASANKLAGRLKARGLPVAVVSNR